MDFEHVGVKTTEFMAATSECRKVFLAACDCRPQYTLAGGVLVVHVVLHQIASYYIMLLQSMARVLKLAGVACSTHRSRGGAPASGHV